jgi:hypothetical protein
LGSIIKSQFSDSCELRDRLISDPLAARLKLANKPLHNFDRRLLNLASQHLAARVLLKSKIVQVTQSILDDKRETHLSNLLEFTIIVQKEAKKLKWDIHLAISTQFPKYETHVKHKTREDIMKQEPVKLGCFLTSTERVFVDLKPSWPLDPSS